MPFDRGPAGFAGMWTVMMAAMMLPGIVPAAVASRSSTGAGLASGYLAVWVASGAIAFGALAHSTASGSRTYCWTAPVARSLRSPVRISSAAGSAEG